MAGRKAGVGSLPDERGIRIRIRGVPNIRPGAPEKSFDDGDEERRHPDGEEDEARAYHNRSQYALRDPRQLRPSTRSDDEKLDAGRPEEPAGIAKPGDPF